MRIYFTKYCYILFLAMLTLTGIAQAKDNSCAGKMERAMNKAIIATSLIPVFGWYVGLLAIPEFLMAKQKIKILQAASAGEMRNGSDEKVLAKFYNRLVKYYPKMEYGKDEVIDILHQFNVHSWKSGKCQTITILENGLFPENKATAYLNFQQGYLAKKEAEKATLSRAAQIREEKNGHDDIRYFDKEL